MMRLFRCFAFRDKRGMALLITIMVVSLLIAVTVQFNRNIRQSYFTSATQLEGQNLRTIARSGLTIGMALLEADGKTNGYDSLQEPWATADSLEFAGLFPSGELKIEIADLSGRLQVNSLVSQGGAGGGSQATAENREILKRLLLSGNFGVENEQAAQEIVDAIVDWLDEDDQESDFGAESSYYRSLNPPYDCRNGPVESLEELLLIKGITPRLLYGEKGQPGLAQYLTVYGTDGRININTAPPGLLQALNPLMTEELATALDDYRRARENAEQLEAADWYRNVAAWPGDVDLPADIITTKSQIFTVKATGRLHDQLQSMTAVVERKSDNTVTAVEQRME